MRRLPSSLVLLTLLLLPWLLLGGCGRQRGLEPQTGTGLSLSVRVAPRGAAGPIIGTVDTIQVAIRDGAGADVVPPLNLPIAPGQRTFRAAIDLLPATDLTVAVLARGRREFGERTERGILWYDRIEGVSVVADQASPISALLESFIPVLGAVEYPGGTRHRILWNRVPGAARYRVVWAGDGGEGSATVPDTTFEGDVGSITYEISAIESAGGLGAPGDPVFVSGPAPPSIPTGLTATGIDLTRIDLSWQASTGVPPITYDLQRRIPPAPFAEPLLASGLTGITFTDNAVSADQTYAYRVRAVGPGGPSEWSAEVPGEVLLPLPGTPGPPSLSLLAPTIFRLAWGSASGIVDAYDVERRVPPAAFAPLVSLPGSQTGLDDGGLAENTVYEYRVAARNRRGASPFSLSVSGQTGITPPAAPSGLTAVAARPGEIDLSWTDNSGNEEGFEIQRAPGGGGAFTTLVTLIPNTTSYLDGNLPDVTPFRYRIRAYRGATTSEFSGEAAVTTLGRRPAAPTNLAAQALTPRSVRLTWQDNSDNEVSFRIEREESSNWITVGTPSANVVTLELAELNPGTNYTFRVLAVNDQGDSDPSNTATVRTPLEVPNAPSDLIAIEVRFDQVRLTWRDNSTNEQGFEIRRTGGTGGTQTFTVQADDNDFQDSSVASRTGYSYEVRAFAGAAFSPYVGPVVVTTPIAPPTNLTANAESTSQIDLAWTPPPGPIGFYDLQIRIPPAEFGTLATITGTATAYTATDLQSGTTYEFRVRARFNQEISDFSNTASATTIQAPPAAPSSLTGLATSSTVITLNWVDNADNEAGFEVEERPSGEDLFSTIATPGENSTGVVLTGKTSNTTYEYRVRAFNLAGPSGYSNQISVTTPNEPPAAPENLTAIGGLDRVDLFWIPGTGGGTPIDYRIERRVQGTPVFDEIGVASGLQTDYGDLGLPTGTTYEYRMRARNNLGFSGYSDTVSVTTILAPPSNLTGFIDPTATTVILFWSDNTTTESGFEIQRADAGTVLNFAPLVTVSENLNFYNDQAVTLGKTYVYRVRAVNAGGNSDWSNELSILVEEFPLQVPSNLVPRPVGGSDINFTWVDTNFNETGYEFQLGVIVPRIGTFNLLFTVITPPNGTNAPFTNLSGGTTYSARVRALGANGAVSDWLGFVCAGTGSTGPNAPSGLTATYIPVANAVQLFWTDNSCNEERFEIVQSGTTATLIGTVEPNTTTFLIPNVTPGFKLYFVRAVNSEASGSSTTVSVNVPFPPAAPRSGPPRGR